MKPLSELIEASEPSLLSSDSYDFSCAVVDQDSYSKMKAIAVMLAKALEGLYTKSIHPSGLIHDTKIDTALSRAKDIIGEVKKA